MEFNGSNVDDSPIIFVPTFNWSGTQLINSQYATRRDPSDSVVIPDKDLVGTDIICFVTVTIGRSLAQVGASFSNLNTAITGPSSDEQRLSAFFSSRDRAAWYIVPVDQNPRQIALGTVFLVFFSPLFRVIRPILVGQNVGFFLFFVLFMFMISEETSTQDGSSSKEATADFELFLLVIIDIVPFLLFFLGNVDGLFRVLVLMLLRLLLLLTLRMLVLILMLRDETE
jgi:hypothetical protein